MRQLIVPNAPVLNIERHLMPQIASADIPKFIDFLKTQGVEVAKRKVSFSLLVPVQGEFDPAKVFQSEFNNDKLVFVANDYSILDGNHRWLRAYNDDPKVRRDVLMADVPILELISLAKQFPKTFYKKLHEERKLTAIIKDVVAVNLQWVKKAS